MAESFITNAINHLSEAGLASAATAAVGYLCARAVILLNSSCEVDPRVGLISGAAVGAIYGLFFAEGSNTASKIVAVAALIFVPYKLCERLEIPATFKAVIGLTAATVAISGFAYLLYSSFD